MSRSEEKRRPVRAEPVSLRERRKRQTRQDITGAAVHLFQDHGYEATSVDDIVDRAGCGRSTFFRYFRSKEDVLFGSANERLVELRRRLALTHPTVNPWAEVRAAMTDAFLTWLDLDPDVEAACIGLWFTEPSPRRRYLDLTTQWESAIAEYFAIERKVDPETDLYCQTLATMITGAIRASLRTQLTAEVSPTQAVHQAFDLLEQGLTSAKHQAFATVFGVGQQGKDAILHRRPGTGA